MPDGNLNKRKIGKKWEEYVVEYLKNNGYIVLHKNYRTRFSEIDIIAQDNEALVFIEVKYRSKGYSGSPLEAVTKSKIFRIRNASLYYMQAQGINPEKTNIRYDVIGILGDKLTHIKGAF